VGTVGLGATLVKNVVARCQPNTEFYHYCLDLPACGPVPVLDTPSGQIPRTVALSPGSPVAQICSKRITSDLANCGCSIANEARG